MIVSAPISSISLAPIGSNWKVARHWRRQYSLGFSFIRSRSEEHTSELQSRLHLVCRLLLEKKNKNWAPNRDKLTYRGTSAGGAYSTADDLLHFSNALAGYTLFNA